MAERIRTAKSLGQRHDFNYFKRWTRWRVWRTVLSIGLPILAIAWLTGMALHKNNVAYSSGPMASVHAVFGKQCGTCHAEVVNAGLVSFGFRKHVEDSACLACHQAPAHQSNQTFTPRCASCHIEHVGSPHLERTADQSCTQCHADLKTLSGSPHYATIVLGFNQQHPEFAPVRAGFPDPGTIKLNHAVHLQAGLKGPRMEAVQLECSDCHRVMADVQRAWKYGNASLMKAAMSLPQEESLRGPAEIHPEEGRAYMAAPTYEKTCMACHTLQFDRDLAEPVPHRDTETVHRFVVQKLTEYIAQHPAAIHQPILPLDGRIPRGPQPVIAHSSAEWIRLRTQIDEELLWRKTCLQCHTLRTPADGSTAAQQGLPEVAKANIKAVWLPQSVFSHYAHVSLKCEACHTKATASRETADVLMPSIKTCQSCHNGQPEKIGSAQNGCFLCHQYHKWKNQEPIKGKYTIPQLTSWLSVPEMRPGERQTHQIY